MNIYVIISIFFITAVLIHEISSGAIVTQIIGGDDTTIEMYPWQAMLQQRSGKNSSWRITCGAVFISERWLLTAAFCFDGHLGNRRIVYGFTKQSEPDKHIGEIQRFITHPQFDKSFDPKKDMFVTENDIALIQLKAPIPITQRSNFVALSNIKNNIDFDACNITGWGFTNSKGQLADTLQVASVPVISNEDCKTILKDFFSIADSQICLLDEKDKKTACAGDVGSALTCPMNETIPVLCDIFSAHQRSCGGTMPLIYTRVSSYLEWIERKTGVMAIN